MESNWSGVQRPHNGDHPGVDRQHLKEERVLKLKSSCEILHSSIKFFRKSILQAVRYFISQALQIASPYQRGNKNFTMFQFYWVKDRDLDFFGHDNLSKIDAVLFAF